ncbi:M48 family metalloprotease [Patescibacteria group bacterium]|nr:M48 family metalloprotease [Patescibacteria group bacterium]
MATIYTQVASNNRKTWALVTAIFVLIIGLGFVFSQAYNAPGILIFAVILSLALNGVGYWYSDKIALAASGAEPVTKVEQPQLYRIVENLAITAGLPTPGVFVIQSQALNAFATGRDKEHASVAVTSGLLQAMDKDELEGVIAHELSHVGNRDILVSSLVVVLVGVISLLADFFLRISFFGGGRRDDRGNGGQVAIIFGMIGAILAPIAATLIQLAVSRRRESLADASGALLTRYPEGLARALEKIERSGAPLRTASSATAHLYIANPFKADVGDEKKTPFLVRIFSTHPPLEERIKALREMSL